MVSPSRILITERKEGPLVPLPRSSIGPSNPVPPFVVGAAIGWGIFCATIYCREENGGGRRVRGED